MQKKVDHWMEVCELAAQEQDVKKMLDLTNEMLRLLDEESANSKTNGPRVLDNRQDRPRTLHGPDCSEVAAESELGAVLFMASG